MAVNFLQGVQLLVEVCDQDSTSSDDLIDILQINIPSSSVMVGDETNVTSYPGMLGFAAVSLSFTVQCTKNFQGSRCSECTPGFTGSQCEVNINDCIGIDCSRQGQCVDGINSFSCNCDLGFTGITCEVNIDECASADCSGHGLCEDGINSFSCICESGFTGATCDTGNLHDMTASL